MESRAKAFGHPIHPMLIVFPLGLLVASVLFDILHLITGVEFFPIAAYYNIAGGIIGGLVAALFGFIDWLAIPGGTRAKSIGAFHGVGNVIVVLLFAGSWLLRRDEPNFAPTTLALVLSFAGMLVSTLTGWLGGELVYRLRVAVDPNAHLDAPNSLAVPAHSPRMQQGSVPVTGEDHDREH